MDTNRGTEIIYRTLPTTAVDMHLAYIYPSVEQFAVYERLNSGNTTNSGIQRFTSSDSAFRMEYIWHCAC